MSYFPRTYPTPNWWAGRILVLEAKRLLQIASQLGDNPRRSDWIRQTFFRNLRRGIRALLELPAEFPTTEAEKQLQTKLPAGLPWEDSTALEEALSKTRDFFFRWYHDNTYTEYTYYDWKDNWDNSYIARVINLSEEQTQLLVEENDLSAAQLALIDERYNEDIEDWISADFEKYWVMEEYDLLSHFGVYGEFRG
jgi:hypothetical protein